MDRYIGIDAHLESCTVAVMSAAGRRLREQVVETNGKALRQFIGSLAGEKHICLEECELSGWLCEILGPLGTEVVVVQAEARRGTKSDAIDAWGLADLLRRGGMTKVIFKAPGRFEGLRDAVHGHRVLTRDVVRAKNRLRAVFRTRGLTVTREVYNPKQRDGWLQKLPEDRRRLAALFAEHLDRMRAAAKEAESWLLAEAQRYPIVRLIATAPGIGEVRASQIVASMITPHRFRTKRQFWSYCGLAVVTESSSDWERDKKGGWVRRQMSLPRGLNRNRHPLLKEVFKGAALSIITLLPDHPLSKNYQRRLMENTKPTLARLTLARQLAATVLAMWKNMEAYDSERHNAPRAA